MKILNEKFFQLYRLKTLNKKEANFVELTNFYPQRKSATFYIWRG